MKTSDRAKQTKQLPLVDPDETERPVFVLSDRHDAIEAPWHTHRRAQMIHVSAGVLTVLTRNARFVVPPQRAVWICPGVEHRIIGRAPFWLTTCYIEPELITPNMMSAVVAVDRLTDELLIAAANFGGNYPSEGVEARLVAVLMDRLSMLKTCDIALPEPRDIRLRRITDRLVEAPSCNESLSTLASRAALTERTAARLFLKDTGLTFGRWRQHMKMQTALISISAGKSVTETALSVGYSDVSSFIAAFKLLFGKTPTRILEK